MSFLAARFGTTSVYGQSTGVYDHYFNTFLNPLDLIWSFLQAIIMAFVVMLVHTYYGFTAQRRTCRGRRGRRPGGADLADRSGIRDAVRLAGPLRAVRQLEPVGIATWHRRRRGESRIHPAWWTLILVVVIIASIVADRPRCSAGRSTRMFR